MTEETLQSKEEEEKMSPEDRMEWLRDRGIEIVTPEERRAARVAVDAAIVKDGKGEGGGNDVIHYVMIPADMSQPLQQLELKLPIAAAVPIDIEKSKSEDGQVDGNNSNNVIHQASSQTIFHGGDLLAEHLQSTEFRKHADQVDTSLLPQGATLVSSSEDGKEQQSVSSSALQQVAQMGNVETFSLIHPTTENQYISTLLYCDEIGMLKRLPINKRASQYADLVGYNPPPVFYGNVFLCRLHQPSKQNRSVTLKDVQERPYASWLQQGEETNLNYQMEHNRITGTQHQQRQDAPIGNESSCQEDGYSWTQTEEELELVVPIIDNDNNDNSNIKKEIQIKFTTRAVAVILRKKQSILSLELFEKIDIDGCTWTIENNKSLIVSMEKIDPAFWPRIQA